MTMKLYHCAEARSTRSLWLLNELGLRFELVELPFDMAHLRAPEYLAIHPLGRKGGRLPGVFLSSGRLKKRSSPEANLRAMAAPRLNPVMKIRSPGS